MPTKRVAVHCQNLDEVQHAIPMLSLSNAFAQDEVMNLIAGAEGSGIGCCGLCC
jgi:NAD-dependent DNA ligase